jgi:hypothetical protein
MRDALTIVLALVAFVAVLLIFFWPLRAIVGSAKVRGLKKFGWVGLWLAAFVLGGVVDNLLAGAMRRSELSALAFMILVLPVGVLPVWGVFVAFRVYTRNRSELQSRAQPLGFALGKFVRALVVRTK